LLLVGGGTGYAPMKAILRHVLETGIDRPVTLYWGARSRADLYDDAWLAELAKREPRFRYRRALLSMGEGDDAFEGAVHEAVVAGQEALPDADIYAAGPPEMIAALRDALPRHGADPARIVFDSFELAPDALARMRDGAPQD